SNKPYDIFPKRLLRRLIGVISFRTDLKFPRQVDIERVPAAHTPAIIVPIGLQRRLTEVISGPEVDIEIVFLLDVLPQVKRPPVAGTHRLIELPVREIVIDVAIGIQS